MVAEKKCFKCGEVKPLTKFYKHKRMADGHINKCKECSKKDTSGNYRKNKAYYQESDRKRNKDRWGKIQERSKNGEKKTLKNTKLKQL